MQDLLWSLYAKYDVLPLQWDNAPRWAGLPLPSAPNRISKPLRPREIAETVARNPHLGNKTTVT